MELGGVPVFQLYCLVLITLNVVLKEDLSRSLSFKYTQRSA